MPTIDDLTKKPFEIGEVIVKDVLSINADVESDIALEAGAVLYTTDNGVSFKVLESSLPTATYRLGVLADNLKKKANAKVVLIGVIKETSEVSAEVKTALFKDNLILI